MKLSILLATTDFRGDHEAEVFIAHEALPGETVEDLASRLLLTPSSGYRRPERDVIQIRVVLEEPRPPPPTFEPAPAPTTSDDIPF